jgi:hypothetical protein
VMFRLSFLVALHFALVVLVLLFAGWAVPSFPDHVVGLAGLGVGALGAFFAVMPLLLGP